MIKIPSFKAIVFQTVALLALLFVIVTFQNCAPNSFSTDESSLGASLGGVEGNGGAGSILVGENFDAMIGDPDDPGLKGGHFDLDTSTSIYPLSAGRTNHHVHEYDDKHNLNYADFFSLKEAAFDEIHEAVGPSVPFYIILSNAQLSPGAVVEINGIKTGVVEYQNRVRSFMAGNSAALKLYSLDGQPGTERLSSFKIVIDVNAILNNRLIPTQTGCVVRNDAGKNGEYRNGALIAQAIDSRSLGLNPQTGVASSGLLWEATIFWHKSGAGCY